MGSSMVLHSNSSDMHIVHQSKDVLNSVLQEHSLNFEKLQHTAKQNNKTHFSLHILLLCFITQIWDKIA